MSPCFSRGARPFSPLSHSLSRIRTMLFAFSWSQGIKEEMIRFPSGLNRTEGAASPGTVRSIKSCPASGSQRLIVPAQNPALSVRTTRVETRTFPVGRKGNGCKISLLPFGDPMPSGTLQIPGLNPPVVGSRSDELAFRIHRYGADTAPYDSAALREVFQTWIPRAARYRPQNQRRDTHRLDQMKRS